MWMHNLSRHHLATDDMDKVHAGGQVAHIDGALTVNAETTHFDTLRVDDNDTGFTLFVVRGNRHLASCWIRSDAHIERFCIHIGQFRNFRQDVGIVAVGHQFTRDPQYRVAGVFTIRAAVLAAHAVGVVGVALVDVGRVELIEHIGVAIGEIIV